MMNRPPWWSWLLLLLGLLFFGNLSAWQWRRAAEKEFLITQFNAASIAPAKSLSDGLFALSQNRSYIPVQLQGSTEKIILRDNQSYQSQAGVQVLRILRLPNQKSIVLNEGWWPLNKNRSLIEWPQDDFNQNQIIEGLMIPWPNPPKFTRVKIAPNKIGQFDTVVQLHREAIEALLPQADFVDGVVLRSPNKNSPFKQNWQPNVFPPERHRGYAIIWAIFFLLSATLFILLNRRPTLKA